MYGPVAGMKGAASMTFNGVSAGNGIREGQRELVEELRVGSA